MSENSKIIWKQNKFNRTAEESIIIGYERGTKKMVESECTRVLYRRVNMFYILPVPVIHWRAAPTHRRGAPTTPQQPPGGLPRSRKCRALIKHIFFRARKILGKLAICSFTLCSFTRQKWNISETLC